MKVQKNLANNTVEVVLEDDYEKALFYEVLNRHRSVYTEAFGGIRWSRSRHHVYNTLTRKELWFIFSEFFTKEEIDDFARRVNAEQNEGS